MAADSGSARATAQYTVVGAMGKVHALCVDVDSAIRWTRGYLPEVARMENVPVEVAAEMTADLIRTLQVGECWRAYPDWRGIEIRRVA